MLTLEQILSKGYQAEELEHRIFLVKGFLLQEEIDELMEIATSATQKEWEGAYLANMEDFCEGKFGRRDVQNLVDEGKLELTDNWNDKILRIDTLPVTMKINEKVKDLFSVIEGIGKGSGAGIIQRQYEGVELTEHVDNHTDPSLVYASVAYLNDDYVGGEVFFSEFNLRLKPKPGELLIFPTSEQWSHGVDFVLEGPVRYVLPIFVGHDNFYKDNKY
jgi:hypothetical protein